LVGSPSTYDQRAAKPPERPPRCAHPCREAHHLPLVCWPESGAPAELVHGEYTNAASARGAAGCGAWAGCCGAGAGACAGCFGVARRFGQPWSGAGAGAGAGACASRWVPTWASTSTGDGREQRPNARRADAATIPIRHSEILLSSPFPASASCRTGHPLGSAGSAANEAANDNRPTRLIATMPRPIKPLSPMIGDKNCKAAAAALADGAAGRATVLRVGGPTHEP